MFPISLSQVCIQAILYPLLTDHTVYARHTQHMLSLILEKGAYLILKTQNTLKLTFCETEV